MYWEKQGGCRFIEEMEGERRKKAKKSRKTRNIRLKRVVFVLLVVHRLMRRWGEF